ncbi:MAG: DUF3137 domain-containing protein [Alphaproteobacteria bacterium]|nr:DUF3137 domain-containing protein [Alphaproteobacteria bacterium]
MSKATPPPSDDPAPVETTVTVENVVERDMGEDFEQRVEQLINDAEAMRLSFMKRHRTRGHLTTTVGLISLVLGASAFGWFLFVDVSIIKAFGSMMIAAAIPLFLHLWTASILQDYKSSYKRVFLPRLAKALGGFKFHPNRGIGAKIISKTGIVPPHEVYDAEDCFMGKYHGVKVLFSEARLGYKQEYKEPIFDGIFVLLEVPQGIIEGHTILTADNGMIKQWRSSRWKSLQDVDVKTGNKSWDRFSIYSDNPEAAKLLVGERLLKELAEAADIFDEAPLSAAFFRNRFVFLMIPYKKDMFEASNIHMPVATKRHAMQCKREIEQILEIIDVFDVYQTEKKKPAEEDDVHHPVDEFPAPSEQAAEQPPEAPPKEPPEEPKE